MWTELAREARSLTESEPDEVANMANTAALLHAALNAAFDNTVIWTGFYRVASAETLMLGPFQGRVACIRIPFGSGVCGAAAARREAVVVPDVDKFPGHIACDSTSKSEVVVPVFDDAGKLIAVLDVDSSRLACFSDADAKGLAQVMAAAFARPRPATPPPRKIKHAH